VLFSIVKIVSQVRGIIYNNAPSPNTGNIIDKGWMVLAGVVPLIRVTYQWVQYIIGNIGGLKFIVQYIIGNISDLKFTVTPDDNHVDSTLAE